MKSTFTIYLWIGDNAGTANKKVTMYNRIRAQTYFEQCRENPLYTSGELVRLCPVTGETTIDSFRPTT